jgi:hypothetical protein
LVDDENRAFAYNRTYESDEIVVVFNKSETAKTLTIPVEKNGSYYNAMNEKQVLEAKDHRLNIGLGAQQAVILIVQD